MEKVDKELIERHFNKVMICLMSCKTKLHLNSAEKMIENFRFIWKNVDYEFIRPLIIDMKCLCADMDIIVK